MGKKRQPWLDVVKGIAIILVVIGHVGGIYGGQDAAPSFRVLHQFIYSFHMPLFLFVSGYLFRPSLARENVKETALSKFIAYGIPYMFFSVIYWFMKTIGASFVNHAVDFRDLLLIPLFPLSFMWYLYALLLMAGLSLLLGKSRKSAILITAVVCRIIWEILSSVDSFVGSRWNDLVITDFAKNYIWFALGLRYGENVVEILQKSKTPVKWLIPGCGYVLLALAAAIGLTKIPFMRFLLGLIGIASTVTAGLLIARNPFLEYMGQNTMQIYLIHGTVISALGILSAKLKLPTMGGICRLFTRQLSQLRFHC